MKIGRIEYHKSTTIHLEIPANSCEITQNLFLSVKCCSPTKENFLYNTRQRFHHKSITGRGVHQDKYHYIVCTQLYCQCLPSRRHFSRHIESLRGANYNILNTWRTMEVDPPTHLVYRTFKHRAITRHRSSSPRMGYPEPAIHRSRLV